MPSKLSILVFIASPLDYARYRHAALYFEFEGTPIHDTTTKSKFKTRSPLGIQEPAKKPDAELESPSSRTPTPGLSSGVEIPESQADIKSCMMEVRINMALPVAATGLARAALVAYIPDTVSVSSLRAVISGTPVAGQEMDWNSQNWVGDALERLVTAGYLTPEQKDKGLDGMVDIILEATDEESA
ncbi:hypothetical protein PDE_01846 [Penicillium oxalicum 114-2]|uniref:Uncharacterized protein n=1 Tax=Penicillium oxalicum (strain 114-2 / CGMCC 5302) TaxID=933388 RepID=S7ZE02_PENO1|nr:hypothetical protein PDE_01846 [Penicillium oxalicum 114-2]